MMWMRGLWFLVLINVSACSSDEKDLFQEAVTPEMEIENQSQFYAEDVIAVAKKHIMQQMRENKGAFKVVDGETKKTLSMSLVEVLDEVHEVPGRGYFVCADFRPLGAAPGKTYNIDLQVENHHGELVVTGSEIHRAPKWSQGKWQQVARFERDLPAMEEEKEDQGLDEIYEEAGIVESPDKGSAHDPVEEVDGDPNEDGDGEAPETQDWEL